MGMIWNQAHKFERAKVREGRKAPGKGAFSSSGDSAGNGDGNPRDLPGSDPEHGGATKVVEVNYGRAGQAPRNPGSHGY